MTSRNDDAPRPSLTALLFAAVITNGLLLGAATVLFPGVWVH